MPTHSLARLSQPARVFLVAAAVLFNVFAVMRALPVNSTLPENRDARMGAYTRNVYRVFRLATEQAQKPFLEVKDHALFFKRNPGMFMFVAELFARAGAKTPFPHQLLSIVLWNVGALLLFLWLLYLFESELTAAAGVGFLMTTPWMLFYSSSIHHEPWCFLFFNLTFYCFMRYLKEGQERRWLIGTWVAYFLLCQSYWHYYVSAGLLIVALQVREQKFSFRDAALLGMVPVVAALTTLLQVAYALGGLDEAWFRMKDIAAARTMDVRIENSQWFPERKFVRPDDLRNYPSTMATRIEAVSGHDFLALASMLLAGVAMAGRQAWARYRFMLLVVLAGFSWFLLMVQHTVIHEFAGQYSWFMWVLVFAVFVHELRGALRPERAQLVAAALAVPLSLLALNQTYVPYLGKYVANVRATSDVMAAPAAGQDSAENPKKSRPPKKAKSKSKKDKSKGQVNARAPLRADELLAEDLEED